MQPWRTLPSLRTWEQPGVQPGLQGLLFLLYFSFSHGKEAWPVLGVCKHSGWWSLLHMEPPPLMRRSWQPWRGWASGHGSRQSPGPSARKLQDRKRDRELPAPPTPGPPPALQQVCGHLLFYTSTCSLTCGLRGACDCLLSFVEPSSSSTAVTTYD